LDRFRRWWNPAKWRDDAPEEGDGNGHPLDPSERSASELRFAQSTDNLNRKYLPRDEYLPDD